MKDEMSMVSFSVAQSYLIRQNPYDSCENKPNVVSACVCVYVQWWYTFSHTHAATDSVAFSYGFGLLFSSSLWRSRFSIVFAIKCTSIRFTFLPGKCSHWNIVTAETERLCACKKEHPSMGAKLCMWARDSESFQFTNHVPGLQLNRRKLAQSRETESSL